MPEFQNWIAFALLALGMVLTPGPNSIYLISRTISQGRKAGLASLAGIMFGFVILLLCTALGLTALIMAVPIAYDVIRIGGALYLLYLAWQTLKPQARSAFEVREMKKDNYQRLFTMGLLNNLLNPKAVILYLSLLPQFITPELGHVLGQSIVLGLSQIVISASVNTCIVFAAGAISAFLMKRPIWVRVQKWFMGTVLAGLAVHMLRSGRT